MSNEIRESSFSVEVEAKDGVTVVHCRGRLVAAACNLLQAEVKPLLKANHRVVLDLTDLRRMDSMGLGTVMSLLASAKRANCKLELINLAKQIRQLFAISNLLELFEGAGGSTLIP